MAKQIIDPKKAPILWETVYDAFGKINDNFTELYLTIGGGAPVDLTDLSTSLIPSAGDVYDLGSSTKRWKDLYLSGNSLYIGNAVVTSTGGVLNIPAGSTIGGSLIKDPIDGAFKTISVTGQTNIVADNTSDSLNIVGVGVSLTTNATTDTLTITNTGVTGIVASTGISVNNSTGSVTITNTGVTSLTANTGVSVTANSGAVTITNTGARQLRAGDGIILDPLNGTGIVTITNSAPNITQSLWRFINVPGSQVLDPANPIDTLTFSPGDGVGITTSAVSKSVIIANTGVTSLAASSGISVSGSTGSVNITNTGVLSLTAGDGISLSASTGAITVSYNSPKFSTIAVQGASPIIADNITDTVTLISGLGIIITTDPVTDAITIAAGGDNQSSIYSTGSTLLVNAESGLIVGDVVNISTKSSSAVFGNNLQNDAGYKVHILGNLGFTSGNIIMNGGGINDAVLNNATGDLKGSIFGSDSTRLVDADNSKIVGAIDTVYNAVINKNDGLITFSGTGAHIISASAGSLALTASAGSLALTASAGNLTLTSNATVSLAAPTITLGSNGTDQVSVGATSGLPLIVKSRTPTTSKGVTGDKAGMIAFSNTAVFYCKADYTTGAADIWNRQTFTNTGVW